MCRSEKSSCAWHKGNLYTVHNDNCANKADKRWTCDDQSYMSTGLHLKLTPRWRVHLWQNLLNLKCEKSTSDMDFVVGRYILIQNIWAGDPYPKKDHTFWWTLHKDTDEGSLCSLPAALPCWEVHFFTDLSAYFFGVGAYTEGQLSHPALWTEHLLNSWSFYSLSAIAELSGPQTVRHYHASNTLYYI